jgi:hypothetical protein
LLKSVFLENTDGSSHSYFHFYLAPMSYKDA